MRLTKKTFLWIILLLPYIGLVFVWNIHNKQIGKIENSSFILISKEDLMLTVYNYKGKKLFQFPISCGKNVGNKNEVGDMKTPEGVFHVSDIQDASNWSHDFGDGNGEIEGAYGPYFIRLSTPGHKGIGIHGTHDDNSIGTRATEGCIRLHNEDLEILKEQVNIGDVVVIIPSKEDVEETINARIS